MKNHKDIDDLNDLLDNSNEDLNVTDIKPHLLITFHIFYLATNFT
jgi:hypothetical protein